MTDHPYCRHCQIPLELCRSDIDGAAAAFIRCTRCNYLPASRIVLREAEGDGNTGDPPECNTCFTPLQLRRMSAPGAAAAILTCPRCDVIVKSSLWIDHGEEEKQA